MPIQTPRDDDVSIWIDGRMAMKHSAVHGIGNFALSPIPAGVRLVRVTGGLVFTPAEWTSGRIRLAGEMYNEERLTDGRVRLTPLSPEYYFNHSCDPNVLNNITVREIAQDEELVTDYAYCEASEGITLTGCCCGSNLCRGTITGQDWALPDLQRRYAGYFAPNVQALINASSVRPHLGPSQPHVPAFRDQGGGDRRGSGACSR